MLSGRVVGRDLRKQGHDVFALDEHADLEGIDDEELLVLAAQERRILITHNVHDFPDILRVWAEAGRGHAGCIILVGMRLHDFGLILRCIQAVLETIPEQDAWSDRSVQVGRADT